MSTKLTRRAALRATGGLGIGIATGSILATNAAAGGRTFADQLNTVREATRKYRDVAVARADGYEEFGVAPFVGHIFQKIDALGIIGHDEAPSLLFYAPNRSGETEDTDLVLAGVEYHVTRAEGDTPPNMFDDENAARNLKVTEADGWHPNTIPFGDELIDVFGIHVWVHLPNPDGVFALQHPTIRDRLIG